MMPVSLFLALTLVVISNLLVAFARLGNLHAHDPLLPTGRLQRIRKAYQTRRHLIDETGGVVVDQRKIIDNLNYKAKEFMNHIEMAITGKQRMAPRNNKERVRDLKEIDKQPACWKVARS